MKYWNLAFTLWARHSVEMRTIMTILSSTFNSNTRLETLNKSKYATFAWIFNWLVYYDNVLFPLKEISLDNSECKMLNYRILASLFKFTLESCKYMERGNTLIMLSSHCHYDVTPSKLKYPPEFGTNFLDIYRKYLYMHIS